MYRLSQPAPELAPYIESYWHVDATPDVPFALSVDVFVDGRADLVFNFGAGYTRTVAGCPPRLLRHGNLDAQRLTPIRIEQRGAVQIVGARFRAGGLMPFVQHSLHRWTGAVVGLGEAFDSGVVPLEATLRERAGDTAAQAAALDAWFLGRLEMSPAKRTTFDMVQRVIAQQGSESVEALSRSAGLSVRSVDRLFRRHLGFAPKTWAQVVRFQRALERLKADQTCPLSQLAAELGYYDQSHLAREYRRFSGNAPGRHAGYFPVAGPADFAPNVVRFVQDGAGE
jgi:AraC-like DNA-binding protein